MKQCSKCKTAQPLENFSAASKQAGYKDGKYPWCKACSSAYARAYHARNKERKEALRRMRLYGLSAEAYDQMVADHDGRCRCCRRLRPLFIDHCHKTKKARGLLCRGCNTALGHMEEDPGRITALAEYAARYCQGGDAKT